MIRKIALTIAIVLSSISITDASVSINEINWMGSADSQFAEWVELYNDADTEVNLAGWKFYEGGGDTLVFTFTKVIPAKGYLLLERATASSPDPIPGVSDESGPFGGSGFSNSGEYLVLKDNTGSVKQSLNFSSGWPAGEIDSKKTMQWDGSKWVTSIATPKASAISNKGDDGGKTGTNTQPNFGGMAWNAPRIIPHVELSIPKSIYSTISNEYSAKVFLEYDQAYSGIFLWNMGDGTLYRNTTSIPINHIYKYPGSYTITFAYYKMPYDTKPFFVLSEEQNVISPTISFRVILKKGFEVANTDDVPVDISRWFIYLSDTKVEIPPFTIVAPKTTITMPFSSFGLSDLYTKATLQTPQGVVISNSDSPKISIQKQSPSIYRTPKSAENEILSSSDVIKTVAPKEVSFTEEKQSFQKKKSWIFAAALLVVTTLFVLVSRFTEREGQ